jgi:hypothetical protein
MNARDLKPYRLFASVAGTKVWQSAASLSWNPVFFETAMNPVGDEFIDAALPVSDAAKRLAWRTRQKKQPAQLPNPLWSETFGPTVRAQSELSFQVDVTAHPYVALASAVLNGSGVMAGDYAIAIHGTTGCYSFATCADARRASPVGECSRALAASLGLASGSREGMANAIIYILFPQSGLGPESRADRASLQANGARWLRLYDERHDLGKQLASCFGPRHPGIRVAFAGLGM